MASESHPFKFICLSMDGLDQNKKSWFMNRNIKGRMERELSKMDRPGLRVVSVRPGGIIPTDDGSPQPPHPAFHGARCHR